MIGENIERPNVEMAALVGRRRRRGEVLLFGASDPFVPFNYPSTHELMFPSQLAKRPPC